MQRLIEEHRRQRVGAEIVEAYSRRPQTEEELAGLDQATRAQIAEEPWGERPETEESSAPNRPSRIKSR
jgi:hypothetical protein